MSDTVMLLTTRGGRITRQQWWTGALALLVIGLILGIVALAMVLAIGQSDTMFAVWLFGAINLAFLWPYYCLGIKRRHDRDSKGTDVVVFVVGGLLLSLLQALGIGVELTNFSGKVVSRPTIWLQVPGMLLSVLGVYLFVQLGFLKGTIGDNSYGPDPLNAAT
ncbi:DUF805 domain-containing protein [Devosia sp. CAU 1758]